MKMEAIRNYYQNMGVDNYYKTFGNNYSNPHYDIIKELLENININGNILDLCAGSGEVTNIINEENVIGCDPYTFNLYEQNTSKKCLKYSFLDIANGALNSYKFDYIICSFAMHLCSKSLLNQLLYQLALISNKLIIITPNKNPEIKNYWDLDDEIIHRRVRLRFYSSNLRI
jgi:SAM-dependent methyltransferase